MNRSSKPGDGSPRVPGPGESTVIVAAPLPPGPPGPARAPSASGAFVPSAPVPLHAPTPHGESPELPGAVGASAGGAVQSAPARPSFFRTATLLRSALGPPRPAPVQAAEAVHPLMPAMYWACSGLFALVPDLSAGRNLPSAAELRARLTRELAWMAERARSQGVLPDDIVEAEYAFVALADELCARLRGWVGHAEWRSRPLQLARFNENTAGENFYRRLALLEGQPHRAHVLQVYFLCMAVGFQGRYAMIGADGLAAIYERVGALVSRALGPDVIAPRGEPPVRRSLLRSEAPLVRLGLGAFVLALVTFVGLRVALTVYVREATRPMHAYASQTRSAPLGKR